MKYAKLIEPPEYAALAAQARDAYLAEESVDPAMARARGMSVVVERCPITLEPGTVLLGGENPFLYNAMLPALQADRYEPLARLPPDGTVAALRDASILYDPCFEGHITPGLEQILAYGLQGIRARVEECKQSLDAAGNLDRSTDAWYRAALLSCDNIATYARRNREEALRLARATEDLLWRTELEAAAGILSRVPEQAPRTLREALQSFWLCYILVTVEMGGCQPGGGLGLGRPDQYLYPFYRRDTERGRLSRPEALELIELFLLCFQHNDYYTPHEVFTPGSQASLGGVTPAGADASNELTELIMEASLRIAMPAPYISLRLHRDAPERFWEAAASFVIGGLGFSVVNDEALIPAFLRHGRSIGDARDYICSCCYEHTIPGREAFHPNGTYVNLPGVLELALHQGRSLLTGAPVGVAAADLAAAAGFDAVMEAFTRQLGFVLGQAARFLNRSDAARVQYRRLPMMSLFIDDCIARGKDVCEGGARYNLTGCIVAGLPNTVNSLAAIRQCVFTERSVSMPALLEALRAGFEGHDEVRRKLLAAPKWGNGDERVDELAAAVTEALWGRLRALRNARGGRWQGALYSFIANHHLGSVLGASADGRLPREPLTRNLDPAWGTDRKGPTAVLESLSRIDFTKFPDGSALDLRFDPAPLLTPSGRQAFVGFLKGFVSLGVMQMQISMVDTKTLLDARQHPERWPNLMVKVAGYSARFVDLSEAEKDEIVQRSMQQV